jgi:hypothetical protein
VYLVGFTIRIYGDADGLTFYLSPRSHVRLASCSRPIRHATGGLFPGIKHPEREANHSLPSDMQPHTIFHVRHFGTRSLHRGRTDMSCSIVLPLLALLLESVISTKWQPTGGTNAMTPPSNRSQSVTKCTWSNTPVGLSLCSVTTRNAVMAVVLSDS